MAPHSCFKDSEMDGADILPGTSTAATRSDAASPMVSQSKEAL